MLQSLIESLESRRMLSSTGKGLSVEVIDGVLTIRGTTRADDVVVSRSNVLQAASGPIPFTLGGPAIRVDFNGETFRFVASSIQSIHADMGAGNDSVVIAKNVKLSCMLIGARGNDTLEGGTRDDVLSGGAGDDFLFGGYGSGRDLMYAGPRGEMDTFGITRGDTVTAGDGATFVAEPPNINLAEGRILFFNPLALPLPPFHP